MIVPAETIAKHFVDLGIPQEKASKLCSYVARSPSLFLPREPLYLRKEETECPFTLQVESGRVFALLKSKVDTPQCRPLPGRAVKKAVDIATGEIAAQYVFNLTLLAKEQNRDVEAVNDEIMLQFERLKQFAAISALASIVYPGAYKGWRGKDKRGMHFRSVIVPLASCQAHKIRVSYPVEEVKGFFLEIAQTIERMHNEGLVHQNIKASHILVFGKQAKLVGYKWTKGDATEEEKREDVKSFAMALFDTLHPDRRSLMKKEMGDSEAMKALFRVIRLNTAQPQYGDVEGLVLRMLIGSGASQGSPQMVRRFQPIHTIHDFIEGLQKKENF